MATDRRAEVTWKGGLTDGSGTIRSTTSGAIGEQNVERIHQQWVLTGRRPASWITTRTLAWIVPEV